MRVTRSALLTASILLLGSVTPLAAIAQDDSAADAGGAVIVLPEVTCKDVMGQGGEERDRSISFMHGYVAGKAGETEVDVDRLVAASEALIDTCLDNPTAGAIATLESVLQ